MMITFLPFILKNYKFILGGLLLAALVIGYKVLVHQRDSAREQAAAYAAIIETYKIQTQIQKDKLTAAEALSQQVQVKTIQTVKYITASMPAPDAPDDDARQWAINAAKEIGQ
jgi:hypothetical protein